jgi:beta-galactosidase
MIMKNVKNSNENSIPADDRGERSGIVRREVLKTFAMFSAAPLATQTLSGASSSAAPSAVEVKRQQSFDSGWRFFRGDASGAEAPGFDDSSWRLLDLPHDYSVEDLPARPADANGEGAVWGTSTIPIRVGPFDTELSEGGRSMGWLVGGTGWYRRRFSAAAVPADGQVEIVFDGVYMNSDVWLNGVHLGNHPYGYTAFAYDLTPHLSRDGENVLAVRVRNEGRNTRWYSGSGIYRHVWINTTGSVRVPLWGVFVTTPEVSRDGAVVNVAVQLENRGNSAQDVTVRIRLFDSNDASAGTREVRQSVAAGGSAEVEQALTVSAPQLWSMGSPQLYRAEVALLVGGNASDAVTTSFGIRTVEVDAERGLRINGESLKLKGACIHHDNGILGACAIDRAEERRVELMKAHGYNFIRTAHNPPSSAFLDACDRLGMLVMDEAFDGWERQKNPQDYHLYFNDWWQRDIDAMVLRDRNHPSVISWSIGNEVREKTEPRGIELGKLLAEHVRTLDLTRPVSIGADGLRPTSQSAEEQGKGMDPHFQYVDIAGYNYGETFYEPDHARNPKRVILGTESYPRRAYVCWEPVERLPYLIGDCVWTGMDHLGEAAIGNAQLSEPARRRRGPGGGPGGGFGGPGGAGAAGGPGGAPLVVASPGAAQTGASGFGPSAAGLSFRIPFPWFNNYCGDIDLIGQAKPQWYYRRVLWGLSKLEMAVQRPVPERRTELISMWGYSDELRSWTWRGADGKTVKVRVYTTGDQVRLFLNGKEVGVKPVSPETELKAEFEIAYAPGELKAVSFEQGRQIAELAFKTVGEAARLRLTADRGAISGDRNDLSFVTLEVLDAAAELVPDAVVPVRISVTGAGELAASGTANPKDVESFRKPNLKTFRGRCLAIVRPKGAAGVATVRAEAAGFAPATVAVQIT